MIIVCPSCKKKFNIDVNLIPTEGRDLQCGSCDNVWFYKKENPAPEPPPVNTDLIIEEKDIVIEIDKDNRVEKTELSKTKKTKSKPEIIKGTQSSKFLSYLIVFIISLGALIILLDTLKTPLINVFPGLELVLFNLYETLKDIKLFIIDLI